MAENLLLHPTPTALWQDQVQQACHNLKITLDVELESYLVFLLMRFTNNPNIVSSIIGQEYLEAMLANKALLQEVGDKCLLYLGFFPQLARNRHVSVEYYVKIGQASYQQLSEFLPAPSGMLYHNLTVNFGLLIEILHLLHQDELTNLLDPLLAHEFWANTQSRTAKQLISNNENSIIFPFSSASQH